MVIHGYAISMVRLAVLATCCIAPAAHAADHATPPAKRIYCLEGWERLLPGDYYACRAVYHAQRNHPYQSFEMLKEAAYWANKDAQHALGLAYFDGQTKGIAEDRAQGIAWLALAAERRKPEYLRDYAVARAHSSPAEAAHAGKIYLQLEASYGDRVAGLRATRRFIHEVKPLDDAANGGGGFMISHLSSYPESAFLLARKVHAEADRAFEGLQGTVSVGVLQRVDDSRARNVKPDPGHVIRDLP